MATHHVTLQGSGLSVDDNFVFGCQSQQLSAGHCTDFEAASAVYVIACRLYANNRHRLALLFIKNNSGKYFTVMLLAFVVYLAHSYFSSFLITMG